MADTTLVSTLDPTFHQAPTLTAQEAARLAGAGEFRADRRRVRVGLRRSHPNFSATYGGISFPQWSETVNGDRRIPKKGAICDLTDLQLRRVIDDAKHKMVRVFGPVHDPIRSEEYDVRRMGAGYVQPHDRPVLALKDDGTPDWEKSLIYIEDNPVDGEAPPADFYEAIERSRKLAAAQATPPTASSPPPGPNPVDPHANPLVERPATLAPIGAAPAAAGSDLLRAEASAQGEALKAKGRRS